MLPLSTSLPFHTLLLLFTKCSLFLLPSPSIPRFFDKFSLFKLPSPSIPRFCARTTCRLVVHYVPTRKNPENLADYICTPKAAIDRSMYYFTVKMTKTLMQLLKWPALRYIVL